MGDVSIESQSVVEADGTVEVTVRLARSRSEDVAVKVATAPDSAKPGVDFYGVAEELTFPSGTVEQSFDVHIIDDDEAESDERFSVRAYTSRRSLATGEIEITDAVDRREAEAAPPAFSIAAQRVDESAGTVEIIVTMNEPQSTEVSHTLATNNTNKTAVPGSDYWGRATEVVFPPGETSAVVAIAIIDDDVPEPEEDFGVRLYITPGSGRSETLAQATITITDTDVAQPTGSPTFSVQPVEVTEGATEVIMVVTLDPPSAEPATVWIATAKATAEPADDFWGMADELEFAAGQDRAEVRIELLSDDIAEPTETFTVRLFDAVGGDINDPTRVSVTILDDD